MGRTSAPREGSPDRQLQQTQAPTPSINGRSKTLVISAQYPHPIQAATIATTRLIPLATTPFQETRPNFIFRCNKARCCVPRLLATMENATAAEIALSAGT